VPTWICLLRAVNLGSHQKVAMPVLRSALTDAGFGDVRTYVQSGNVVLTARTRTASRVGAAVRSTLAERLGVDTPVLVRTPAELAAVAAWNPFPDDAEQRPQRVYVTCLPAEPPEGMVAELLAVDWSPDRVAVRGTEVVAAYADGMHASRLERSPLMRRVCADGTARNWRTLRALLDLSAASPA
jgi:uncharacterized protein (DUF1697 family)